MTAAPAAPAAPAPFTGPSGHLAADLEQALDAAEGLDFGIPPFGAARNNAVKMMQSAPPVSDSYQFPERVRMGQSPVIQSKAHPSRHVQPNG